MITFDRIGYMGRLGNQMFQFASILGIGRRMGYDAKFPLENCAVSQNIGPIDLNTGGLSPVRCNLLDCFNIEEYFIPASEIRVHSIYTESVFQYDPSTERVPDGSTFVGYYQTEKYFDHIREDIKKIFSFKSDIVQKGNSILNELPNNKKRVSLHIRRGDYTLYPDHHPTCDISYYIKALNLISDSAEDDLVVIIFSDDKKWCSENLHHHIKGEMVISSSDNPYVDLYMMTQCEYHIIANSSYSWWGSWLSESKLTVAPSRWFGPAINKNTSDVYSKGWEVL